jgi:hypothetical protein
LLKNDNNNDHNSSIEKNSKPKLRSITDFFSEGVEELRKSGLVDIISFEEFLFRESNGLVASAASRLLTSQNEFIDSSMVCVSI